MDAMGKGTFFTNKYRLPVTTFVRECKLITVNLMLEVWFGYSSLKRELLNEVVWKFLMDYQEYYIEDSSGMNWNPNY